MSRNTRFLPLSLTSLLLATAACPDGHDQSAAPPTGGDESSTGDGSGSSGTTAPSSSSTTQSGSTTITTSADGSASASGETGSSGGSTGGSEDSSGSEGTSSGVAEPTCDAETHRCAGAVPDGWSGPVAVTSTPLAQAEACEGAYANPAVSGFTGLDAPDADCDCSCSSPSGDTCETETSIAYFPPNFLVFGSNTTGCEIAAAALTVSGLEAFDGVVPSRWLAQEVDAVGGSCNPSETVSVPDASFEGRVHACAPTEAPASCDDDGVCMPLTAEPFDAPLCIWKSGSNACPDGYPEQQIVHQDFVDDRGCSECECGAATGMSCDDSVFYLWTGFTSHEMIANGTCQYIGTGDEVTAINFSPGQPSGGSCAASGGNPTGSADATQPSTICCES